MAIGRNNSPARSRRTGNSPAREPQTPRSGGSSEPNWSTTLPKAPVPSSRVPNPAPPPLGTFPTEILAPKSYVSFESEPTPGWLARNATVPGHARARAFVVYLPVCTGSPYCHSRSARRAMTCAQASHTQGSKESLQAYVRTHPSLMRTLRTSSPSRVCSTRCWQKTLNWGVGMGSQY